MQNLTWKTILTNNKSQIQKETPYEDIDRDNLKAFQIVDGDRVVLSVPFKDNQGQRLIWRRRVEMSPGGEQRVVHIVGKRGGFVAAVFDDESVLLDDNFNQENDWLYPPEYKDFEAE